MQLNLRKLGCRIAHMSCLINVIYITWSLVTKIIRMSLYISWAKLRCETVFTQTLFCSSYIVQPCTYACTPLWPGHDFTELLVLGPSTKPYVHYVTVSSSKRESSRPTIPCVVTTAWIIVHWEAAGAAVPMSRSAWHGHKQPASPSMCWTLVRETCHWSTHQTPRLCWSPAGAVSPSTHSHLHCCPPLHHPLLPLEHPLCLLHFQLALAHRSPFSSYAQW